MSRPASGAAPAGRQVIATYGAARQRVRVVRRDGRLVAEWYERRLRREKSWPDAHGNVVIARAWAQTFARERVLPTVAARDRLTLRQVWDLFEAAKFPTLRTNTRRLYADDWRKWELYAGANTVTEDVTRAMLHGFRRALEQRGLGVSSVAQAIKTAKLVYAWAEREELIARNRWRLYKYEIAKDARPRSPDEYAAEEVAAMLGTLDPRLARQWRAWVALTLLDEQGVRQVAGLQLKWADLRLVTRQIAWPAETDKNGRAFRQPLTKGTVRALRMARDWARRQGVTSEFVLYSPKQGRAGEAYTAQALWAALRRAEAAAGVAHRRFRAAHGLRRRVVGDLAAATGDTLLALRAVNDRDPRMATHYRKDRDELTAQAFRQRERQRDRAQDERDREAGSGCNRGDVGSRPQHEKTAPNGAAVTDGGTT